MKPKLFGGEVVVIFLIHLMVGHVEGRVQRLRPAGRRGRMGWDLYYHDELPTYGSRPQPPPVTPPQPLETQGQPNSKSSRPLHDLINKLREAQEDVNKAIDDVIQHLEGSNCNNPQSQQPPMMPSQSPQPTPMKPAPQTKSPPNMMMKQTPGNMMPKGTTPTPGNPDSVMKMQPGPTTPVTPDMMPMKDKPMEDMMMPPMMTDQNPSSSAQNPQQPGFPQIPNQPEGNRFQGFSFQGGPASSSGDQKGKAPIIVPVLIQAAA